MTDEAGNWGDWMGGWKAGLEDEKDGEADRIDRQKAAFGAETLAKLKDLNVLILGMRGVGVESAKNLILSNVGAVVVWDQNATEIRDLGSNFYLTEQHVAEGTLRTDACLPQLKSLNPYCKVEAYTGAITNNYLLTQDVNGTGKPFAAVIVTQLLPKSELFRINQTCRTNNIAFLMAFTSGITSSLFSDFGPKHIVNDATGEPVETKALSNIEVMKKPPSLKVSGIKDGETIVVLTSDSNHDLDDGAVLELDDMNGNLAPLTGKRFKVSRMEFVIFDPKREFSRDDSEFKQLVKNSTDYCGAMWHRMLVQAEKDWAAANEDPKRFKSKLRSITLLDRLVLREVEQPEAFAKYSFGGLINPVAPPLEKSYSSLEETLVKTKAQIGPPDMAPRFPQMLNADAFYRGDGIDIHLSYAATLDFQEANDRWPRLHCQADANEVVKIAEAISEHRKSIDGAIWTQSYDEPDFVTNFDNVWGKPRDLRKKAVARFARFFGAELTGFCAYLGGAIAQEVIKKTGKFTPIDQWIHHEDIGLVCDEAPTNTGPPMKTRYDDQIAILGKDFQRRAANQRVFLVGCGALGCEYLKGMALMGVGVGKQGKVTVTDMDTIETSNLSRQFLFRSTDVGYSKSISGARVVKGWNPEMNVEGIEKFVGPSTENYFTDGFWEELDVCWNALDNVKARQYTDGRCLWYSKPLLESGTTGTKTNSEVILPFRTSTYNDGKDPPEVAIAMCTLRSFPYLPLHCIEFAKQALYTENFEFGPEQYQKFRTDKDAFFASLDDMAKDAERMDAMNLVKNIVDLQKGGKKIDFDTCIKVAFDQMIDFFRNKILGVTHAGDVTEKKEGKPYWTGTKRRPNPVDFTPDDDKCIEYLYATSNMFAFVFGVDFLRDREKFEDRVRALNLTQPEWKPSTGASVADDDEEGPEVNPNDMAALVKELRAVDVSTLCEAHPHDFEKDDDDNFHIDYLTIATNLRAWNYNIKETQRHAVKVIAGRIIPALATTTAMICGLVDIEFCKLVLNLQNLGNSQFYDSNFNLALGSEAFSVFNPMGPKEVTNLRKTNLDSFESFTTWDKLEFSGDLTGVQLAALLQSKYGAVPTSISGETNYNPPKSVSLWKAGEGGGPLSAVFKEKLAIGEEEADRSPENKKRAKSELKKLQREPINGVSVALKPDDAYTFQVRMEGPKGSPYEGGLFLIEVKLPMDYPIAPPKLAFLTPIEHCNIKDGVPCPNLLFGSWSKAMTVHSVLTQLDQLLKEQQKGDALIPELAAMSDEQFLKTAQASVTRHATHDQQFPTPVKKVSSGGEEAQEWPHDYLILKGEYETKEGEDAFLPRIKLNFTASGNNQGGGAASGPTVEPVEAELAAKIMAMNLEIEGDKFTQTDCYKLQPERAALLSEVADGLTAENGVAVTGTLNGEVMETIVNSDTMEHMLFTDPIMYTEMSIATLVEAQFEEKGEWILSRGNLEAVESEKSRLFEMYEKAVTQDPPDCLSTLRRMLQAGPITTLYTGGGNKFVPSHEGFSLRMPKADLTQWQMINDKKEQVDIPRPVHAVRAWNPTTRSYDDVNVNLSGAPTTPEAADSWFVGVVKKLKQSNYIGSALLNALVTSKKTANMEALGQGDLEGAFEGEFSGHWTDLVVNN